MLGIILGTLGIVAVTVAIGVIVERRLRSDPSPEDLETQKQRERRQLVTHAAGEAPSSALRVREPQIAKLRASQRCPQCRAEMQNDADDTVQYGDASLLLLHFSCPTCTTKRTLYIDRVH